MFKKKIKKIIHKIDRYLFKKFGSEKNIKSLENLKEAKIIFSCLNKVNGGDKVKFVGGCVRKALFGEDIDDIDLATSLEPTEVKEKLEMENIKVIETGIAHGTVTAILNKKKFEITTLRKDISTDGRHANVEYTKNWEEDALRRDLTINAIYGDINGKIFDPLGGMSDLFSGKINFIGLAEERIQEDYLRILRYFRFFIQYSKSDHDSEIINSIRKNINGLNKISNERIFDELKKILSLENIFDLFLNAQSKEIILNIFPQFKFHERLKIFNKLNKQFKDLYNFEIILALMIVDGTDNHEFFSYKYKISNNLKDKFKNFSKYYENLKNKKFYSKENIKKLIYLTNRNDVKDILIFSRCATNKINDENLKDLLRYINSCKIPKFPISGDDLKRRGYVSGQKLGKKLKSLEEKWINNNFVLPKN